MHEAIAWHEVEALGGDVPAAVVAVAAAVSLEVQVGGLHSCVHDRGDAGCDCVHRWLHNAKYVVSASPSPTTDSEVHWETLSWLQCAPVGVQLPEPESRVLCERVASLPCKQAVHAWMIRHKVCDTTIFEIAVCYLRTVSHCCAIIGQTNLDERLAGQVNSLADRQGNQTDVSQQMAPTWGEIL